MRKLIEQRKRTNPPPAEQKGETRLSIGKLLEIKEEESPWDHTTQGFWGTTPVSVPRCEEHSGATF